MNIGGTLINTVLRLLVVVATLAAVYYFILKPVLATTEKVTSGMGANIQKNLDDVFRQVGIPQHEKTLITRQVRGVPRRKMAKLERCVSRAGTDINRIQRCANRFSP